MNCARLHEIIKNSAIDLFDCRVQAESLVVTTPFTYPDGDLIDIFIKVDANNRFTISDCGETLRYLIDNDFEPLGTIKRRNAFLATLKFFDLRYENGEISKTVTDKSELFSVIFDLAQSVVKTTDLLYTRRITKKASFREVVQEFFDEEGVIYTPDVEVMGGNDQLYILDFELATPNDSSLVTLLTTSNPNNITSVVNRAVRMWTDISANKDISKKRLSIIDDTLPSWKPENIASLGFVSHPLTWSKKEHWRKDLNAS